MLTVIWGVNGTYVIDFLLPSTSYYSSYFNINVLDVLNQKVEQIRFKRTPHPPFSPDIAPSDYFLFGFLKGKLQGLKFKDFEQLKDIEILTQISRFVKIKGFDHWIERCQWIIDHEGSYFK